MRSGGARTYVRADLLLEVAVFGDLFKLVLLLFFCAGAIGSGYSMLRSFPSVNRLFSWLQRWKKMRNGLPYTSHCEASWCDEGEAR